MDCADINTENSPGKSVGAPVHDGICEYMAICVRHKSSMTIDAIEILNDHLD